MCHRSATKAGPCSPASSLTKVSRKSNGIVTHDKGSFDVARYNRYSPKNARVHDLKRQRRPTFGYLENPARHLGPVSWVLPTHPPGLVHAHVAALGDATPTVSTACRAGHWHTICSWQCCRCHPTWAKQWWVLRVFSQFFCVEYDSYSCVFVQLTQKMFHCRRPSTVVTQCKVKHASNVQG